MLDFVVLYGYQGADVDAEQLALTDQLFDAAFGELRVVARGEPSLIVGDFNVKPPKFLAWLTVFRLGSGSTWKLLGRWLEGPACFHLVTWFTRVFSCW